MMTPTEIQQYVALMREQKIMHMKCGDLELTMHPGAFEAEPDQNEAAKGGKVFKLTPLQQLKKDLFDEEPQPEE